MKLPKQVQTSAPAKVLLFGEHAVVYGYPSIAATVSDLRLYVMIERFRDADSAIEFTFSDILEGDKVPLRRRYSCTTIVDIVKSVPQDDTSFSPIPNQDLVKKIDTTIASETEENMKTLRPAIFLCCALLHSSPFLLGTHGTLRIHVSSKLPLGAGLGSSAAFSVALAGALSQFRDNLPSSQHDQLELVNSFAYSAEVLLHGTPSGVDNAISTFGGVVLYRKPGFQRLVCQLSSFRFLIVNTKVSRSTKQQVTTVRYRFEGYRELTELKFHVIEEIVNNFVASQGQEINESFLGAQMERNHEILNELGVGHEVIDQVVEICKSFGLWTKITGAGGGGCTLSLIPQTLVESELINLLQQLEAKGFQVYLSSIGGDGLSIQTVVKE